jgi:hypothetical protein
MKGYSSGEYRRIDNNNTETHQLNFSGEATYGSDHWTEANIKQLDCHTISSSNSSYQLYEIQIKVHKP